MKVLFSNYSISGNVVTLTGVNRPKEAILSITDATSGAILYTAQTGGATAYTQGTNSTITLSTTPGSTDNLQIFYDDGVAPAQPLTNTQLRASAVPVSLSSAPLPSGAAQDGTDGTGITPPTGGSGIRGWLSGIYSKLSSALAVSQSGTWSVGRTWTLASSGDSVTIQGGNSTAVKVDGTAAIQLGSGVVTATTQRVTLATDGPEVTNSTAIKNNTANIPAKGAATIANSTPVNIASDQTVPVSLASVPSHAVTNAGTFAVQPSGGDLTSGSQTTKLVNGSNTLAINADGSLIAASNLGSALTYTATGAVSSNTVIVGSTDVSAFRTVNVQVSSLGSGMQIAAETSNDNSTWQGTYLWQQQSTNGIVSNISGTGIWIVPTYGARYFRLRASVAQSSGTTTITAYPSKDVFGKESQTVSVTGTSVVNPTLSINYGFSSAYPFISAASANATLVKNTTGVIGTLVLTNTTASFRYVLLFNSATAPTSGSTAVLVIPVAPNSSLDVGTGFVGMRFSSGISFAMSTAYTTAFSSISNVGANEVILNMTYA